MDLRSLLPPSSRAALSEGLSEARFPSSARGEQASLLWGLPGCYGSYVKGTEAPGTHWALGGDRLAVGVLWTGWQSGTRDRALSFEEFLSSGPGLGGRVHFFSFP